MRGILNILYIGVLCLFTLSSCADYYDYSNREAKEIKVGASVVTIDSESRSQAVPYKGSVPTDTSKLNSALLFSLNSGDYNTTVPTIDGTNLPCHTTIEFQNGLMTIPDPYLGDPTKTLRYPTTDQSVFCVGLCPETGWSVNAKSGGGSIVKHSIDGITDIMYAPEISGSWNTPFSNQEYTHLQSWVKVCIEGLSYDAKDVWGNIESVKLISNNNITIDLTTGAIGSDNVKKEYEILDVPIELKITNQEIGSVFCYPTNQFTLRVKTTRMDVRDVTVKVERDTKGNLITDFKGRLFVVILYFNSFDVIDGVCTLSAWSNVNENLYLE